jgi:hypothetical protein
MSESLNQDFTDLLKSFADGEVRFLVVGAYALAVHGYPRATGDLDVWVDATPENARRTFAALAAFGAPLGGLTEIDLARPGVALQIGLPPSRIDILTEIDGVTFSDAWERRTEGHSEALRFPVIGGADLLTNKRATGRTKDLADAEALEQLLARRSRTP